MNSPDRLKVTQTIAGIARESGGPSYSVPALASALSVLGARVMLRTLSADSDSEMKAGYPITFHPRAHGALAAATRMSTSLRSALLSDFRLGAIVHCHGLWLMPNVYPALAKRDSGVAGKIVHSPRGMLGPAALRISSWKKLPFWYLLQRSALRSADCLHATAMSEYDEIRTAGLLNPVAVIPNGIHIPDLQSLPRPKTKQRIALSLGRLHPKKGLDRLVRAWAAVEPDFPDWSLRIIGPPEIGHDEELRSLAGSLCTRRLSIEKPLFGIESLQAYRSSDLFVLPTLNENFGMTVAESLACEVPVVSTKGAPWAGLEEKQCGWWIDHGVEPLTAALRNAMTTPRTQLYEMGARGREWMARDFGWNAIASDMLDVYRWLLTGGAPPSTVRIN